MRLQYHVVRGRRSRSGGTRLGCSKVGGAGRARLPTVVEDSIRASVFGLGMWLTF